jgi:hypothetical protein
MAMKTSEFKKGQSVIVTTKNGNVKGVISSVDTNICTWETEYSVDYLKNGKTWTMIGVPARAIDLA